MSARLGTSSDARRGLRGGFAMDLFMKAAERLACGSLELILPDGSSRAFEGAAPGPGATLHVHDAHALTRAIARGDTGFAEAFMDGDVDTPGLEALLELGAMNEAHLSRALRERMAYRVAQRVAHWMRRNNRRGSRRNIAFHYDLGNDFYRLWLDRGMTYSAGLFEHEHSTLEDAQAAKYRRLLDMLDPAPGSHLLEIGCGWGGLAEMAVRERDCRVTALTLSREQHAYTCERLARAGLAGQVDVRLQDYRDVTERFDHVVSIEMFEAVGERYWDAWFASVVRCLRPGGRAAVQVITIDDEVFPGYRAGTDFIQRYIFPGGLLPGPAMFRKRAHAAGLRTLGQDFFGAHYARTLELWHREVIAQRRAIMALGFDERFMRMWRYYLAYCRAGFVTGRVDLMQTLLVAP